MSQLNGGCLCGGVRYDCDAAPLFTAVCQCRNCQKQAGTAFSVIVAVPRGALHVHGDSLASYADRGDDSGQPVIRYFCRNCGSPIKSEVAAAPAMDFIKAGTLDDVSWLAPQVAVWCDSAQPWVQMDAAISRVPRNPAFG
jgi:hypothetical protein